MRTTLHAAWVAAVLLATAFTFSDAQFIGSFNHGIASGDPLPDRIILWTRVTPRPATPQTSAIYPNPYTQAKDIRTNYAINVTWTVYSDAAATRVVTSGVFTTDIDRDWTVKADAGGLSSGIQYFYNFKVGTNTVVTSDTGTFRLPQPVGKKQDKLRYFVLSCSNWGFGYFNAYDVASRYDLDFWIHEGDYLYEYSVNTYPAPQEAVRYPGLQPETEIQTLSDYRQRHATYRLDAGLQALTASAPLMSIWDDHDFFNNIRADGAENHYPGEINFYQRKYNAAKVYYEWMPIREPTKVQTIYDKEPLNYYAINRTFEFGDLATVFMLEDRVTARTDVGQNSPNGSPAAMALPNVFADIQAIVGTIPLGEWNASVVQKIKDIQKKTDIARTNASQVMMGPSQIAWIAEKTNTSARNNITWQLYHQGTIMQDWFFSDYEAALANANSTGNSANVAAWSAALNNVTGAAGPSSTYTYTNLFPAVSGNYSKVYPVTPAILAKYRAAVAIGRYRVNFNEDSYQGYIVERNSFLAAIKGAKNPVVYAGDSHSFYAGYLYSVDPQVYVNNVTAPTNLPVAAVEFDTGSVTSSNFGNSYPEVPLDFTNAAWIAANPNMFFVEQRYHGGIFVELTPTNHHAEMIYVDTIATANYTAFCGVAYDLPVKASPTEQQKVTKGKCGPIPAGAPYQRLVNSAGTRTLIPPIAVQDGVERTVATQSI